MAGKTQDMVEKSIRKLLHELAEETDQGSADQNRLR